MKLRVSSVTDKSVGGLVNEVSIWLEDELRPKVENSDYGIEQFSIFFISVDSDILENDKFCQMHNRFGKYKNILDGRMTEYVSIAVPADPAVLVAMSPIEIRQVLVDKLIEQLARPVRRFPKKFENVRLLSDLRIALGR